MNQLSSKRRELVSWLTKLLGEIPGIKAVVLGGSYARGRAQPDSDIDLGVLYSQAAPFSIERVRELAREVNDTPSPVVTDFYGWGAWVNGGAWLTIDGQRVDLIYRNLEQVERVIAEAEAGRYEMDYTQQPPFGFLSLIYLGEVNACIPLVDSDGQLELLKRRVANYPDPLRKALVQDYLWQAEFGLRAFAKKYSGRADAYGTAACLSRAINQIVQVLFALNRRYPINDKTALAEAGEFERAPGGFEVRVQKAVAHLGTSTEELRIAVQSIAELHRETVELSEGLYRPLFSLP